MEIFRQTIDMSMFNTRSEKQLNILLVTNIFGIGVIFLPRIAFNLGGFYSFVFVLIAGIIALIATLIIKSLTNMYEDKSFYEYSSIIVGKPLAFLLSIGFIIRILVHAIVTIKIFAQITRDIMLPETPLWVISLAIILVSVYAASKGYENISKIAEIFMPLIIIPILVIYIIAMFSIDYSIFFGEVFYLNSVFESSILILYAFTGIELLLHTRPYTKIKVSKTILALTFIIAFITLMTQLRFSSYILRLNWPVIELMDSTLRRQGAIMMSFFIISVFSILNACIFFSSLIFRSIFKKGGHNFFVVLCGSLVFIATLINFNPFEVLHLSFTTLGIAYMLIIPVMLLVLSKTSLFKIVITIATVFFLVSCGTELSELDFVVSIKIEQDSIMFKTNEEVKSSKNNNLEDAIKEINENSTKNLYFGFTEAIIVYEISDDIINELSKLRNLNKTANLLTTEQMNSLPEKGSVPKKFKDFTIEYYSKRF